MGVTPNLVGGVWTGAEDRSVHFESITFGQGANMALPIWASFMRKVYDDPSLPYSEADVFEKPADWNETFDCPDYDEKQSSGSQSDDIEDEFYF